MLTQPDGNMFEEGARQFGVVEHLPRLKHDGVRQTLAAEAAHVAALRDQLRGPCERREQVCGFQRIRQSHLEERVSAEVIVGRRSQQRKKLGCGYMAGP